VSNDSWLATPWTAGTVAPRPSGAPEPLAFVVTDENGVIHDMNDVFLGWTRFARDRVIGAPHSIVRHPGMPAGLFKLVWDRLKTGQPVCAYLQNLPADGNTYTALVTMSPTTSGYLAVQQKPCRPEAAEAIHKLYTSVRAAEFEAIDDGAAAEAVPARGAELLVDLLRQLGFSSYDDFMWTALPQEVDEYDRRSPGYVGPVPDDGSAAAAIMAASQDLSRELSPWSQQQAELLRTWGTLSKTLVSLSPMMEEAKKAAEKISDEIAQEASFQAMSLSITVWASMIAEIEKVITDLPNDLLGLRQACAQTRFWIGLAQIHTAMVRQYALDFADAATMDRSRGAVSRLCITLDRDFDDLSWRMEKNARFAATVAERIQSLHDLLAMPANLIVNWKAMTQGSSDEFVTRLLPEIDNQLNLAGDTLDLLQTLADQCQAIAVVQPMDVAHQCVARIQQVLAVAPEQTVVHVDAAAAAPVASPQIAEAYAQLFRAETPEVPAMLYRDTEPIVQMTPGTRPEATVPVPLPTTPVTPGAVGAPSPGTVLVPGPIPREVEPDAYTVPGVAPRGADGYAEPDAYPVPRSQASAAGTLSVTDPGVIRRDPGPLPVSPTTGTGPGARLPWPRPAGASPTYPIVPPPYPVTTPAADPDQDVYATLSMLPMPSVYASLNDPDEPPAPAAAPPPKHRGRCPPARSTVILRPRHPARRTVIPRPPSSCAEGRHPARRRASAGVAGPPAAGVAGSTRHRRIPLSLSPRPLSSPFLVIPVPCHPGESRDLSVQRGTPRLQDPGFRRDDKRRGLR
jgi:aerotaxis receptor